MAHLGQAHAIIAKHNALNSVQASNNAVDEQINFIQQSLETSTADYNIMIGGPSSWRHGAATTRHAYC